MPPLLVGMGNNSSGDRWFWMTVVATTISWAVGASAVALSAISAAG